jgi:hypothetical protein
MDLLTQNSKLKNTSKLTGKRVFNFGIPAYKTASGKLTCPFADSCIKFCYAQKGAYIWSNVKPAFEKRYQITLQDNFADIMQTEINKKRPDVVRVHDSGDYYSRAYLQKWLTIFKNNPNVHFYSYTNSISLFKELKQLPNNFTVIYSDSGKQVNLIDKNKDRHTKIFKDKDSLIASGFVDASKNDLFATTILNKTNNKIGLIYH